MLKSLFSAPAIFEGNASSSYIIIPEMLRPRLNPKKTGGGA